MPTYEYECLECAHRFEAFQSMKDEPLKNCERCGAPVKRLIGAGAGIIFKGSGFYVTDYRKGPAPSDASSGCTQAASPSCDSCAKSDTCS